MMNNDRAHWCNSTAENKFSLNNESSTYTYENKQLNAITSKIFKTSVGYKQGIV